MRRGKYSKRRYVSSKFSVSLRGPQFHDLCSQLESYWRTRPSAPTATTLATNVAVACSDASGSFLSEYDRHRQTLLTKEDEEGWAAELRRYLKDVPADVTKKTDIVEWWQVCTVPLSLVIYCDLFAHLGKLSTLPDSCTNRTRCSSLSSILGSMRTPFLGQ
jgi:hypothetical protein